MSGGFILNTRRRIKGHYLEPVPNGPNANTGAGFTARRPPTKTVLDRSGRANSAFIKRLGSWFSCRSTPRAGWLHLGTDEMKVHRDRATPTGRSRLLARRWRRLRPKES